MTNKDKLEKALDAVKEREMKTKILSEDISKCRQEIMTMFDSGLADKLVAVDICTPESAEGLKNFFYDCNYDECERIMGNIRTRINERVSEIERVCANN